MHGAKMAAVDDDAVGAMPDGSECEWMQAHRALSRLARQRAQADAEEGRWLLRARRAAAHVHMGFGTFTEYVERLFGYCARSTHEKLRVAEALEHLPVLAEALESGALCWSALRELTRVATPETESAWLDVARGTLSRQLESLVTGVRPGDLPSAARSPDARRHVLRFDVTAETYAAFRESVVQLRRASDASLDDDAVLLAMARVVLGGPRDDGRASYQVSLCVCPECGGGTQTAGGAIVPVGPAIVTMAACDAQQIGFVSESAESAHVGAAPNATLHDRVALDDGSRAAAEADVPVAPVAPVASVASVASAAPKLAGVANESAADLANVPSRGAPALHQAPAHVDSPSTSARRRAHVGTRATQTIPPAVRRHVLHRDHHRCRVPGCQNATYLDVHHLLPRAEGGPNTAANLIPLCGAHHRAVHTGALVIEGSSAENVRFLHADGTPYGHPADPHAMEAHAKVFSGLRNIGFREAEARAVLDELRRDPTLAALGVNELMRAALERIPLPRHGRRPSA